jgi:hypothetical protein
MSLIRVRRERKVLGSRPRAGMRTRTLVILLAVVLIAIWYLGSRV